MKNISISEDQNTLLDVGVASVAAIDASFLISNSLMALSLFSPFFTN
jgi:hypothetical protein